MSFHFIRMVALTCALLLFYPECISAQDTVSEKPDSSARKPEKKVKIFAVPLLFYSYDTRWGAGVGGILTFPGKPLRSSITISTAFTQREQILLFFPFQWYSGNGKWRAYGELGWFRYFYQYFGIGNTYSNQFAEPYTAQYPRLRLTLASNLNARQLAGLRLQFDDFTMIKVQEGGEIDRKLLTGSEGGRLSSIGAVWLYDSRDNQFFPHKGAFVELSTFAGNQRIGSNFKHLRLSADAARYFPIGKKQILVIHGALQFSAGDIPFFLLPQLGGPRRLRGYPDGKFRDLHSALLQSEFRFPLFWRFKGVGFLATGAVFGRKNEAVRLRPNAGAGLRFEFDRTQHLHLRLDYGFGLGKNNNSFYLTIGEAF
jgi:outer membrane protein assembly factor BamA